MTRVIRTLIVDDEPLAREGLRVRLEREDDVEIVGEAIDGQTAIDAILAFRPDLVFLDVQMPGPDGFEVVSQVADVHLPAIVFVTAFDRYALRAFAVHALDYVLKPIGHRRLQDALRRVRRELERDAHEESVERLRAMLEQRDAGGAGVATGAATSIDSSASGSNRPHALRFTVRDGDRFVLVRTVDVDWIEAAANYSKLHVGARTFQLRVPISELRRQLDPAQFARIHRSTIVNLDRVRDISPELHGEYAVTLTTGPSFRVSRAYRQRVLQLP